MKRQRRGATVVTVKNRDDLFALDERRRAKREDALGVVSDLRADPSLSLTRASRRRGIDRRTVYRYAGDAFEQRGGRLVVSPADRLYRAMWVWSAGRRVPIDVRGSRAASLVSAHHNAIRHYLETGDDTTLRALAGRRVGGVELEADPDVIDEIARRGEFDFESIYQLVL